MLQDYMINGIIPGSYTNPTVIYTTTNEHNLTRIHVPQTNNKTHEITTTNRQRYGRIF